MVGGILVNIPQFDKHRHRHLKGIDPVPVVDLSGAHHAVDRSADGPGPIGLLSSIQFIEVEIDLSAALVVCIAGEGSSAQSPLMLLTPLQHIVEICLLFISPVQFHQSFIIHGSCPDIARPLDVCENGFSCIRPFVHEILVGKP